MKRLKLQTIDETSLKKTTLNRYLVFIITYILSSFYYKKKNVILNLFQRYSYHYVIFFRLITSSIDNNIYRLTSTKCRYTIYGLVKLVIVSKSKRMKKLRNPIRLYWGQPDYYLIMDHVLYNILTYCFVIKENIIFIPPAVPKNGILVQRINRQVIK